METISLYQREGSSIYGCLLDCTKAFDTVQQSLLFKKLLDHKVPQIFIRLLIQIYVNQTANVRWQNYSSSSFTLKNGVRQGAVLSLILFCFYMNGLFKEMKNSKNGCQVGPYYSGMLGYADDLLLLCPSRGGLQEMLNIAQKYAQAHNVRFSTNPNPKKSKTKGMIFRHKNNKTEVAKLELCNNKLPWVEGAKYLGIRLTDQINGLRENTYIKRARYIERNCEINQEFHYVHPELKCKLNKIYNSSFPGSILWDLTSVAVQSLINTWSISVRHMWNLPRETHRSFIEPLEGVHAKTMLYSRFVKFVQSITKGNKLAPIYLLESIKNNTQTVTGRNIKLILQDLNQRNIEKVKLEDIKSEIRLATMNQNENWKIMTLKELTNVKHKMMYISDDNDEDFFTSKEIEIMINDIATF